MSVQSWQRLTRKNNVLRWGIFPGKYFYIADFFEAAYEVFPQRSVFHWPQSLGLFVDNEMLILVELDKLQTVGKKVFEKYFLDQKEQKALIKKCYQQYKTLQIFLSSFPELTNYSQESLVEFGQLFLQQIINFWLVTLPVELANYGGWALLESEARAKKWDCSLIDLITLDLPTFLQQEELDLAKNNDINAHQQKYFWLKNSYHHTEVLPNEFFSERKKSLSQSFAKKQRQHFEKVKAKKSYYFNEYQLTPKQIATIKNFTLGLWLQEERKQYILQLQHFKDLFLQSAIHFIPNLTEDRYQYSLKEVIALLQKQKVSERSTSLGVACKSNKVKLFSASEAQTYWQMKNDQIQIDQFKLQGKVLIVGTNKYIRGIVTFFDPLNPQPILEGSIVIINSIGSDHLNLLRNAKAIIIESCQTITHTLLAALAHSSFGNLPTLIVVPSVTTLLRPFDKVSIAIRGSAVTLRKIVSLHGSVACAHRNQSKFQGIVWLAKPNTLIPQLDGKIVILPHLSLDTIFSYRTAACIITDIGGITSHGAIICRELGITCIVGVGNATKVLCTGDEVMVDFTTGNIDFVGE